MKRILIMSSLFLTLMLIAGPTYDEQTTPQFTGIRKAIEQTVLVEVTILKVIRKKDTVDVERRKVICSGVVIEKDRVLTCAHSIWRLDPLIETPFFEVNTKRAKVLKRDFDRDLILLKTSQIFEVEPVVISEKELELLDTVTICGYPMGMMKTAFERKIMGFLEVQVPRQRVYFTVDGTLYRGTSGGPIFNEDWELVGTVSSCKSDDNGALMGICVDRDSIINFINENKDDKK